MKSTLWTKNFTIITLGTLISAIGGVAMQLALSLVVFDQTESTFLSGLFTAASLVPGMTLAIEPMINAVGDDVKVLSDGWTVMTKSGSPSAHFEHTVVVTKDGYQILTGDDNFE